MLFLTYIMLNIIAWSGNFYGLADRDTWCLILQPGVEITMLYRTYIMLNITAWSGNFYDLADRYT